MQSGRNVQAGCPHTAVFTQYLQRVGNRHQRFFHSRSRLPDGLGGAGRIASEHGFDGACRTGAFARPFRLGTLYRYRHQAACDTPQAPCLHVVGWVCTTKREADRQSKSFDIDRTASVSSVGISRFFRLPPFFTGKQLFESTRYRTDKLEAMNADIAVAAGVLKSRLSCTPVRLLTTSSNSKTPPTLATA